MRITVVTALVSLLAMSSTALGQSNLFKGSRLFLNHSMKYDVGRTFGIGLNFTIAPIKAVEKKVLEAFRKKNPKEYEVMLEVSQYVDPKDIKGLNVEELKAKFKAVPQLSAEQRASIDNVPISNADPQLAADLVRIMQNPVTAITFSFEPYAEFHFDFMDLTVTAPMAGFDGDEIEFAMGNLGLDARFGHHFGSGVGGGISYGLQVWTPTATEAANALGLANLIWSPRYFHEYMTIAPYFVAGVDLNVVTLQANVGYNAMVGVKGDPDFDMVQFLAYGFSASVTVIPALSISAELSGLADIKNAAAYNTLYLTAGLRFSSSIIDLGLAAQVPVMQERASSFASFSNVSFGGPSDFNMVFSATFGL